MTSIRSKSAITWRAMLIATVALAVLSMVSGPGRASAADATLYELTENMSILLDDGVKHRRAISSLTGWAALGTPLCPSALVAAFNPGASMCVVNATGSDNIDTTSGKGDFKGTFAVVVQGDNATDAPELVVLKGRFSGKMDFSPALLMGVPYGTVSGVMKVTQGGRFPFTGVFRLPFPANYAGPETGGATLRQLFCPLSPSANPYAPYFGGYDLAYVGTSNGAANGQCIDIAPNELSLGTPLVRFEITFGAASSRSQSEGDQEGDN